MTGQMHFLPEQASQTAGAVDLLSLAILIVTSVFSVGIAVAVIYFTLRYWHPHEVNRDLYISNRSNWMMELTWSGIPLLIVLGLFGWGAVIYFHEQRPPSDGLDVYVVAKQWMWKIEHEGGRREIDTLHVPTGQNVRLTMTSEDVIHSFFVPAFRTKQDVLPGRITRMWFQPNRPGRYHLFCAEYCGTSHSKMIGEVVVQSPEAYAAWLAAGETERPAQQGLRLLTTLDCLNCHGEDAEQYAPSLLGLYGSEVPLADGTSVTANEEYIRRAIVEPQSQIVAGYKPRMPSYEGQIEAEQILQIIAYIKSVAETTGRMGGPSESANPDPEP